jgi:hypothetical protein
MIFGRAKSILAMVFFAMPSLAGAGAWTLDQNTGQLIVTGELSQGSSAFDGSRNTTSTPRYSKFELQTLLEYGFTDRFTLMIAPGYQHIDIAAPISAARSGFGYTDVGARYKFLGGDSWVFSGQVLLRTPGTDQATNPAAIGYTDSEVDARALFGTSFKLGNLAAFVDLQVAQRFRLGGPPDEFRFDATFGLYTTPNWLLLFQSFSVIAEGAGSTLLFPSYDYSKFQISAAYRVMQPLWLQVGAFTTFTGRNALQENGLTTGIIYKF